jgi:hypothetical protein
MMNWFPVLVGICCLALPLRGEPDSPVSTPPRWLVVVDTSSSMNRLKPIISDILHELFLTGLNNRMQSGDIFEIWAMHQEKTAFPYRVWTPEQNANIAASAKQWLERERFQKKLRMDLLFQEIQHPLQASETISLLLVSDGTEPLQGTPFDQQINAIYREHHRNLRRAKVPFVVVLTAHQGKFISWVVHSGGGAIHIPALPATIVQTQLQANPSTPPPALAQNPPDTARTAPPDPPDIEEIPLEPDSPQATSPAQEWVLPIPDSIPEPPDSGTVLLTDSPELSATPDLTSIPPEVIINAIELEEAKEDFAPEQSLPPGMTTAEQQPSPAPAPPPPEITEPQPELPSPQPQPVPSDLKSAPVHSPPIASPVHDRATFILVFALITLALIITGFYLFSPRAQQPSLISKSIERKKPRSPSPPEERERRGF